MVTKMENQYNKYSGYTGNRSNESKEKKGVQFYSSTSKIIETEPYSYIKFPDYLGIIPLETDFFDMLTAKQAKEYLEWYKQEIPKRVSYLISRCASELGIPKSELLKFPEGCLPLWRWFRTKLVFRPTTQEEQNQMRQEYGFLGEWHVLKKVVTEESRSIAYDISMYLGNQFVLHYPNDLEWGYVLKPKDIVYFKSPIVTGFMKHYNKKGKLCKNAMSPTQVVGKQWCKVYHPDLQMKDDDLYQSAVAIMAMVKTAQGDVVPPVTPALDDL